MCTKSKKKSAPAKKKAAVKQKAPAARAQQAAEAAASPAGIESGASGSNEALARRRARRGKRNMRLAGQNKLRLSPAKANVGGSGRTGLNIPRSS